MGTTNRAILIVWFWLSAGWQMVVSLVMSDHMAIIEIHRNPTMSLREARFVYSVMPEWCVYIHRVIKCCNVWTLYQVFEELG